MAIKYKWLAEKIQESMISMAEHGSNKLPTENELMDQYSVSRQTVRSALELLEEKGYIEKKHGSGSYLTGLFSQEHNTIAILLPEEDSYIYPELLFHLKGVFHSHGFRTNICSTFYSADTERDYLQDFLLNPPVGVIIFPAKSALPNPNIPLYKELAARRIKLLFVGEPYPELSELPCVREDDYGGLQQLLSHLSEKECTRIGCLFRMDDLAGLGRFRTLLESAGQYGLQIPDQTVRWYDTQHLLLLHNEHDVDFLARFVTDCADTCNAVICQNDEIAYWLIRRLRAQGFRIPEDIAVVSFDNSYLSDTSTQSITTLGHASYAFPDLIADTLLCILKGLPCTKRTVPWTLHIKESS